MENNTTYISLQKPKVEPTEVKNEGKSTFEPDNNNFAAFGEDNFGDSKATTGFDDSFGSAFNGNAGAQVT